MAPCKLYIQLVVSVIFLHTVALNAINTAWSCSHTHCKIILAFFAAQCIGLSFLYMWTLSQRPSRYYTILTLHVHLVLKLIDSLTHRRRLLLYTKSWKNPRYYQERCLQEIIKENGNTTYGRLYYLSDIKSIDEFCKRHPLTTYEHYRPYVERMMRGEENVLTKKTPTSFCRTTGTTGKPKYIPYVDRWGIIKNGFADGRNYMTQRFPSIGQLQKTLSFYVHPIVTKTEHGAKLETIATFPELPDILLGGMVTPAAGFKINSTFEANYVHLVFGLRETDVGVINVNFLTFFESIVDQLKKNWKDIVRDIATGNINSSFQLPDEIRSELSSALGNGNPERANQLRREFQKGFAGILKRVWPRLVVICSVDHSGIWPKIQGTVAQGVSFAPIGFACTEGFLAWHIGAKFEVTPDLVTVPAHSVTEFIKLEDTMQTQPRTYFLDEVEVDEFYEIVITQPWSGLYRYRIGDVIQITGFYHNCPTFRFKFRLGQILNLHYEKLSQNVVEESVQAAVARWSGASLVEYTVAESTLIPDNSKDYDISDVPFYFVFLELEGWDKISLTDEEKGMVDEGLRLRNADYNRLRREGAISRPRVYLVRPGSFEALRDFIISGGTYSAQYKSPRKLLSLPMVELMMQHI